MLAAADTMVQIIEVRIGQLAVARSPKFPTFHKSAQSCGPPAPRRRIPARHDMMLLIVHGTHDKCGTPNAQVQILQELNFPTRVAGYDLGVQSGFLPRLGCFSQDSGPFFVNFPRTIQEHQQQQDHVIVHLSELGMIRLVYCSCSECSMLRRQRSGHHREGKSDNRHRA